ncbi:hypothetical protein GGR58DRAFT_504137 [Xylaria digitata]|nr:hypothetical protein GGR58DRAFT_504137 [Xylaria digitata]
MCRVAKSDNTAAAAAASAAVVAETAVTATTTAATGAARALHRCGNVDREVGRDMEVGGMEMEKAGWLTAGSDRRRRDWLGGQMQETEDLRCGITPVRGSQAKVKVMQG